MYMKSSYIVGIVGALGLFFASEALAADIGLVRTAREYTISRGEKENIKNQAGGITGTIHTLVLDGKQLGYPRPPHITSGNYSVQIIVTTLSGNGIDDSGVNNGLTVKIKEMYDTTTEELIMKDGGSPAQALDGIVDMAMKGKETKKKDGPIDGGMKWVDLKDRASNERVDKTYDTVIKLINAIAETEASAGIPVPSK
ncbi:hypothetical protein HYY70_03315 [Candidatus Woesearchaeota archaeon]|nr:hypothetical protein [Candidatus Woesearchaeota archaeon]